MQAIITATGLNFLDIISYPNITILAQQVTFICGESGCGKSTLLKLMSNVVSPDAGVITYQGENIQGYSPVQLRKQVLLCGQFVYLFDKTIEENFHEFYDYRDLPHLNAQQITQHLDICCLRFPLDTPCATLSGGERHRVFLAICLSLMPNVLMLDEPTAALDDQNANLVLRNVKTFCKERDMTLLVVCHNRALAEQHADHIISLEMRRNP